MEGEESPTRNLWDLSASAQTQLIQILNDRYPDNEQFIRGLNYEYMTDGNVASMDFTRKKLRMVFTISKSRDYSVLNDASGRFSPADRIEYLKFNLRIPEKYNLRFTEWNRYSTEYGEIEIADVSFSRSFEMDMEGALTQKGEAGGKGSLSRNEQQEVRTRYLKLNGSISDREIGVEEEGTREIDLTGNVIADVSLEFEGFPERLTIPLFAGESGDSSKEKSVAALRFVDVLVPRIEDIPDTIRALLHFEYIYRHVQTGWKTYQEWDDRVEYYSGSVTKEVSLFTRKDFLPAFYTIGAELAGKNTMKIETQTGTDYPLQFKDYSDANQFMEWLLGLEDEDAVMVGKNTLLFDGKPVTSEQIENEKMKVIPVY
jgi:hypothetical protein